MGEKQSTEKRSLETPRGPFRAFCFHETRIDDVSCSLPRKDREETQRMACGRRNNLRLRRRKKLEIDCDVERAKKGGKQQSMLRKRFFSAPAMHCLFSSNWEPKSTDNASLSAGARARFRSPRKAANANCFSSPFHFFRKQSKAHVFALARW